MLGDSSTDDGHVKQGQPTRTSVADSKGRKMSAEMSANVASSIIHAGGKMLLRRKGSDTAELMKNEQVLESSDSESKFGGITNLASESTTFTSLGSTLSTDNIPYMDHTSSEEDAL